MAAVWIEVRILVDVPERVTTRDPRAETLEARRIAQRVVMEGVTGEDRALGFAEMGVTTAPDEWEPEG